MTTPFTPDQEARLREIMREEIRSVAEEAAKGVSDYFRRNREMERIAAASRQRVRDISSAELDSPSVSVQGVGPARRYSVGDNPPD